jgi:hypothetical protein
VDSSSERKIDIQALRQWVGRQEIVEDSLIQEPANALAATLDAPGQPAAG